MSTHLHATRWHTSALCDSDTSQPHTSPLLGAPPLAQRLRLNKHQGLHLSGTTFDSVIAIAPRRLHLSRNCLSRSKQAYAPIEVAVSRGSPFAPSVYRRRHTMTPAGLIGVESNPLPLRPRQSHLHPPGLSHILSLRARVDPILTLRD